jgi:hypothetical protein
MQHQAVAHLGFPIGMKALLQSRVFEAARV